MAYREVAMWEILSVLRRLGRGESKAAVAAATGHSRSTVRRYASLARELGWTPSAGAANEPSEALAAEIGRRVHPAAERGPGDVEARLLAHREQIRAWLTPGPGERRGLRLTKVHALLARQGVPVPYSSLHRFAVTHCAFAARRRVTVRMAESPPGELAEIDFGRLGLVWDPLTGRRRTAWALVVVLACSRHQYVHVSFSQRLRDVIEGLEDAWAFFGGVVRRVVLDNLRAAITTADRYAPVFQRTFEEYARYRDFVIDPAPVRQPTGKPHVERGVPYVRESFFRGESWRDLAHVQAGVIRWCLETAGTRTHGTTRQRPLAVFEDVERAALTPLTGARFDPPRWTQCTVHPDHHVSCGQALYSVPTRYIGQRLWVRVDSQLVRLYADGALVKTHVRQPPGGRATDHADYPAALTPYTLRDPARLRRQARAHGPHVGAFADALLAEPFPWAKLRQAQRLLRLGEKYGGSRLDAACQRALAFELVNVRRLDVILRQDLAWSAAIAAAPVGGETRVYPLRARFARDPGSFAHHPPAAPAHHAPHQTPHPDLQEPAHD
ncbi:MAG TPA: IS21 family transposase [Gemmatimonadaceae bacterium]|nr:IS21 family transposase [Gemmatimonadaceae bacterium]